LKTEHETWGITGLGGGQVFNLWGSNPTGVPRAQAVAMAGAGTYAAAGRGNLAYALNLRKPAQGLLQGHGQPKDAWKGMQTGTY
jgi:hypothetical protein